MMKRFLRKVCTQERLQPVLRFFSGISGLLLIATSLLTAMDEMKEFFYLQTIALIFLFLAGNTLLVCEFAPAFLFENYIIRFLPWLGMRYGKSTLLVIAGTFCFDPKVYDSEHVPNLFAGWSSILTGLLWAIFYFTRVEANPSDYRGFQHPQSDLALKIRNPQMQQKSISKCHGAEADAFYAEMQAFSING